MCIRGLQLVLGIAALLSGAPLHAQSTCADDPAFAALDFWIGEWEVRADGAIAGQSRIEKVLGGCAITELWTSVDGGEGRSLFYYVPARQQWRQVWVTQNARAPGGVKEKQLTETFANGGVRFQGEIALVSGGTYLDRTTLTPLRDRRIRQHIEISTDGGITWRTTFDGLYSRR
jgi:hypothetical protein